MYSEFGWPRVAIIGITLVGFNKVSMPVLYFFPIRQSLEIANTLLCEDITVPPDIYNSPTRCMAQSHVAHLGHAVAGGASIRIRPLCHRQSDQQSLPTHRDSEKPLLRSTHQR